MRKVLAACLLGLAIPASAWAFPGSGHNLQSQGQNWTQSQTHTAPSAGDMSRHYDRGATPRGYSGGYRGAFGQNGQDRDGRFTGAYANGGNHMRGFSDGYAGSRNAQYGAGYGRGYNRGGYGQRDNDRREDGRGGYDRDGRWIGYGLGALAIEGALASSYDGGYGGGYDQGYYPEGDADSAGYAGGDAAYVSDGDGYAQNYADDDSAGYVGDDGQSTSTQYVQQSYESECYSQVTIWDAGYGRYVVHDIPAEC